MLGISFDPPEENAAFREDQEFPYPLLSDTDHSVAEAYGVAGEYKGTPIARRVTFLIDPDGVVRRVYEVSDVDGHADEVLADLKELVG